MKPFYQILSYLYPQQLLKNSPFKADWHVFENKQFLTRMNWLLVIGAIAYVFHYFFVDAPANKQPRELWLIYRFGMCALALVTLAWYNLKILKSYQSSRLPGFIAFLTFCYFQGQTMMWHAGTPYFFSYVMAVALAMILGDSMVSIMIYFAVFIGVQIPAMAAIKVESHLVVSYTAMFFGIVILTSARYRYQIQLFISEKTFQESERKNLQMEKNFSNLIQAFLPTEVLRRYRSAMQSAALSPNQALENVLQRREVKICCLYSDIRGYTQKTKNNNQLLRDSIVQEIQALHRPIEDYGGIARKIGDLIFAYFDDSNPELNVYRSLLSAIDVQNLHRKVSHDTQGGFERQFIVTAGDALCGNIGLMNSMIEVTALGRPVNLAARIDETIKAPMIRGLIKANHIVISQEVRNTLTLRFPEMALNRIDLTTLGNYKIRDFAEETCLYLLESTQSNYDLIASALRSKDSNQNPTEIAAS